VVERFALEVPEGLVKLPTTGEQQHRAGPAVAGETLEKLSLIVGSEVEDAVPGDQAIERAAKGEMTQCR
jgi:hypothetical protein